MSRKIETDLSEKEAEEFMRMAELEGTPPEELFAEMLSEGLDAIRVKIEDARVVPFKQRERNGHE